MKTTARQKTLLVFGSLVFSLLSVEFILRLVKPEVCYLIHLVHMKENVVQDNDHGIMSNKPYSQTRFLQPEFDIDIHIRGERLYYAKDDGHHWNARAHRLAAQLLYDCLISQKLLPQGDWRGDRDSK